MLLCYFAGIRSFRQWKCEIKKNILINGRMTVVAEAEKKGKLKDIMQVGLYRNIKDARKRLKQTMPDLNEHHLKLACIPNTEASLKAFNWFEEFLTLHGDYAPNRFDKVELPGTIYLYIHCICINLKYLFYLLCLGIYTKESIWGIYARHMNTLYTGPEDQKHLERTQFEEMWNNVFPNVTITKFTQVSGKCYTCHAIFDRQANFTCREELLDIKDLASIHKILIGMQRGQYIHNRQLAQEYPELYMSLILDGMSQDHCQLPYCANQDTESTGLLKQKIFGAKQHGVSKTFYRTYPYVESGANLACEVLLHEIEHRMKTCIQNCTDFPRHLMLQIDGGPENTSKTFYGLCESLVKLGVFDRIDVSRLPVGHTHEDIDALFGVLWRAAQFKTLITPDEWKKMAKDCFNVIDLDD